VAYANGILTVLLALVRVSTLPARETRSIHKRYPRAIGYTTVSIGRILFYLVPLVQEVVSREDPPQIDPTARFYYLLYQHERIIVYAGTNEEYFARMHRV
jgi:hypothetical protein